MSRQIFIFSPPLPAGGFQDTYYVGQQGPAGAVRSDTDGHYRVDLPPGTYSLLVEDQGKRYCGRFFEQVACVVTIDSAGHLAHDVLIEHAVF